MNLRRAAVIGGGLGGLAAALRLAARGWQVRLFEQGPRLGGKMNLHEEQGYRFDTGPSLITMPWVFRELYALAGARLEDHVTLERLHPLARYVYDDGTSFTYSTALPEWMETLRELEPRDVEGFFRLMRLGSRIFSLSQATFLRRPPSAPPDRETLAALRHFPLRGAWGNYHRTVAAHLRSPYLRRLFDRYPTYVGSSPHRCPATLLVIPYIEYAFGGWYVRGGLYRIVESLATLAEGLGVDLNTGARVEAILRGKGRVTGVRLAGGAEVSADAVVMNGDASCAGALLGESGNGTLPPEQRSLSGLVFLWGLGAARPELHHHTVFFSADYAGEFRQLFDDRRFPDDPTVYVSAPSRGDRSLVPGDGEALFVMANAPADDRAWGRESTEQARRRVLDRLAKGGLAVRDDELAVDRAMTPSDMAQRYLMPGGAIYGTHSHGWRRAFFRPPNRHPRYDGLYFVGGSTHPGGGTPTVLMSAKIACDLVESHVRP